MLVAEAKDCRNPGRNIIYNYVVRHETETDRQHTSWGNMKTVFAILSAFLLAFLTVGAISESSEARPGVSRILEVCGKQNEKIPAGKLPSTVNLDKCPVGERPVVDNGAEALLPEPGKGIHAETLFKDGAQELVVVRQKDGTIELGKVGDDTTEQSSGDLAGSSGASSGPNECRDRAYNFARWKVYGGITYQYNYRSTPRYLGRRAAERQVRIGGANIVRTRNACRMGDRVESGIGFRGGTRRVANVARDGSCQRSDGASVVSFGDIRGRALAVTCTYFRLTRGYDRVTSSDLELDRTDVRWTTRPGARSCRNAYDIQAVVTHERGHTFGMGHVSERYHGNLTMSPVINGPCQASERTLGRGDVLGLGRKYR